MKYLLFIITYNVNQNIKFMSIKNDKYFFNYILYS